MIPEELAGKLCLLESNQQLQKKPVQKAPGRNSREGGLGRYSNKHTRKGGAELAEVDLYFLGYGSRAVIRPYGLACDLTSLHALWGSSPCCGWLPLLVILALGVLITGWFNIIIQSSDRNHLKGNQLNLWGLLEITFIHRALCSHGKNIQSMFPQKAPGPWEPSTSQRTDIYTTQLWHS